LELIRRTLLKSIGLLPMTVSASQAAEAARLKVQPRHVLCFLGGEHELAHMSDAAHAAIGKFATGFEVDTTYSIDHADAVMVRSFGVCWDRVAPGGWTPADEEAVANHKSVLYVLSPRMRPDTSMVISTAALFLVEKMISSGATAAKGESAGVAHGVARWRELALRAAAGLKTDDDFAVSRICRLAFAKRPLESEAYVESVGYHLVGLPEVYVAKTLGTDLEKAAIMDTVADELTKNGVDAVLRDRKAKLSFASGYAPDDFKFNPYGIIHIDRV
jgi:hypothetical protein